MKHILTIPTKLIKALLPFCSIDPTRPAINGVNITTASGHPPVLRATDGRRLIEARVVRKVVYGDYSALYKWDGGKLSYGKARKGRSEKVNARGCGVSFAFGVAVSSIQSRLGGQLLES